MVLANAALTAAPKRHEAVHKELLTSTFEIQLFVIQAEYRISNIQSRLSG
jgi:hypothetical protein